MSTPYLGEIRAFGFNFAPRGWMTAAGQLLPISQYTALFSLLGTFYGGNGTSNFQLPDLRSRVPLSYGQGLGLSNYVIGEEIGSEQVTLLQTQLPAHTHTVEATAATGTSTRPGGGVPARSTAESYAATSDGTVMNAIMITPTGGNQPFQILQPALALNFCIAMNGIFPSRN